MMRRINQYRKLFNIEKEIDLKELKSTYRSLIKEWHPDKFQDLEKKALAEEETIKIVDGYHFLVSIAPETIAKGLDEYNATVTQSRVVDFQHKSMMMELTFEDGNTYEYFGINRKLFLKYFNAKSVKNFGRRHIYNSYLYRKSKRTVENA